MPNNELMKQVLESLLPPGDIWAAEQGADFDLLLEGKALTFEETRSFLECLAHIRNPNLTPILSDLEKEFGILTNNNLSEEIRRTRLAAQVFFIDSNGSEYDLQKQLRDAGFDVYVYQNNPAIDPAIFLDQSFQMVADGGNAFAGRADAYAGKVGGELLVNGDIFTQTAAYLMQADGDNAFAGNGDAVAGRFDEFIQEKIEYSIPTNPEQWPLVFFVGGEATRDPGTGELTDIELAEVDLTREEEFKRTILKFKPIHSWAGLIINYT